MHTFLIPPPREIVNLFGLRRLIVDCKRQRESRVLRSVSAGAAVWADLLSPPPQRGTWAPSSSSAVSGASPPSPCGSPVRSAGGGWRRWTPSSRASTSSSSAASAGRSWGRAPQTTAATAEVRAVERSVNRRVCDWLIDRLIDVLLFPLSSCQSTGYWGIFHQHQGHKDPSKFCSKFCIYTFRCHWQTRVMQYFIFFH